MGKILNCNTKKITTYLRFCSLQSGCLKASHNDFTPPSPISLPFRSRCSRFWLWIKQLAKFWQPSEKVKNLNLQKKNMQEGLQNRLFCLFKPKSWILSNIPAISYPTLGFSCSRSSHKFKFQLLLRKTIGLQLRCPRYPDNWYSQLCLTLKERKAISGRRKRSFWTLNLRNGYQKLLGLFQILPLQY